MKPEQNMIEKKIAYLKSKIEYHAACKEYYEANNLSIESKIEKRRIFDTTVRLGRASLMHDYIKDGESDWS